MATKLNSYKNLQDYLTTILTANNQETDAEGSKHGAFWKNLTYNQFVSGTVPGVKDPITKAEMPILVKGNASQSNIILALQGAKGTPFDPNTGAFGQMPADGPPFFTSDQIQPIIDWINAGCPE